MNSTAQLRSAVDAFIREYAPNRSYNETVYQLRQIINDLNVLEMSPGQQAARAALPLMPTGQQPTDRREAPSTVQKADR